MRVSFESRNGMCPPLFSVPSVGLFTPGCQIGYNMDHTGSHQLNVLCLQNNVVVKSGIQPYPSASLLMTMPRFISDLLM
jgi:hypothetical protein